MSLVSSEKENISEEGRTAGPSSHIIPHVSETKTGQCHGAKHGFQFKLAEKYFLCHNDVL